MTSLNTTRMKKLGGAGAVLLLLFVAALPAAAACCVEKPMSSAAAMHASMACCGDPCQITNDATSRDHEIALTSNISKDAPVAVTLAVVTDDTPGATERADAGERVSPDLSPPSPFLLHRQFRI